MAKILTDVIACKGDDCPGIQPANTATANNPQSNETVMNFALESIAEQEEAKMSILNNIINVIQWGFIILICLIILFILYQILKNAFVYTPDGGDADKIKIGDGCPSVCSSDQVVMIASRWWPNSEPIGVQNWRLT